MLRASLKKALSPDPYVYMFLILGTLLGCAFHIFNPKGQELVQSVIGALSSPELFYLLLTSSGVLLCTRNVFRGPIDEVSSFTKNIVMFPGETAIEAMKSLFSLLFGLLIPLWIYSEKLGYSVLLFLFMVLITNFSASVLFSLSYKETCPKWVNNKAFRMLNGGLVFMFTALFYWLFIRDVT